MEHQAENTFIQTPDEQMDEYFENYTRKMLDGSVMPLPFVEFDVIENRDPLFLEILCLIADNKIVVA